MGGATTARNHCECPALSEHDTKFQCFLIVLILFHYLSFLAADGHGCPNGIQPTLITPKLLRGGKGNPALMSGLPLQTPLPHASKRSVSRQARDSRQARKSKGFDVLEKKIMLL
jgi:hypothetical protein